MKVLNFLGTPAGQVLVIVTIGGAALYYAGKKAEDAAEVIGGAVNPNSPDNLVYRGVNAVGTTIAGKPFNLGHWLYDAVNGKP
jgi:Mn2+/Fe2+ NRAMP family transporter